MGVPVPDDTKVAGPNGVNQSLPLPLIEWHSISILDKNPAPPMVTVCRGPRHLLPAAIASPYQVLPDRKAEMIPRFLDPNHKQESPTADRATLVYLVGPMLNSGESWAPVALSRKGNTITLELESWTDDGPRRRNIPARNAYLLALDTLPIGQYELIVEWKEFLFTYNRDKSTGLEQYAWTGIQKGKLAFEVGGTATGRVPSLEGLAKEDLPREANREYRQKPFFSVLRVQPGGNLNGIPKPGLRVGATDLVQWLQQKPANLGDAIQIMQNMAAPAASKQTSAVILGPSLAATDSMILREIAWKGTTCILRVDVWSADKPEGERTLPVLVGLVGSPYFPPAGKTYDVEVEWRWPGRDPAVAQKNTADYINKASFSLKDPNKP